MVLPRTRGGTNARCTVTNGGLRLDGPSATPHSGPVERQQTPTIPLRWILVAASALGAFSTTEAVVYHLLYEKPPVPFGVAFSLNYAYWYAWALLTLPIL